MAGSALKRYQADLIALLALLLVVALFLGSLEFIAPRFFLVDDNLNQYLPYLVHNWRAVVEHHTIPLLNFHQFLGQTYLGNGLAATFYPPGYVAMLLSLLVTGTSNYAIDILSVAHLLAASVSMYVLLRRLRVTPIVSSLISFLWITFPYNVLASQVWVDRTYFLVFLPLNFLLLDKMLQKPRLWHAVALGLVKTIVFAHGYVQSEFMLLVFELLFLVVIVAQRLYAGKREGLKQLGALYVLSLAIFLYSAAPLLAPTLMAKQYSAQRAVPQSPEKFVQYSMPLAHFVSAQLFNFTPNTIFWASSRLFYVGVFNLALFALLGFKRIRRASAPRRTVVYSLMALSALIMATPLHSVLYYVPLFNNFRWPHKYFLFALFFAAVALAGIIQAAIERKTPRARQALYALLVLSIALNILVFWKYAHASIGPWRLDDKPQLEIADYIDPEAGRIFTYQITLDAERTYKYVTFDHATRLGYYHFGGYDILVSQRNADLTLNVNSMSEYRGPVSQTLLDYLSKWSVKYIVTRPLNRETLDRFEQLKPIFAEGEILLYENTASRPFVYFAAQPNKQVPFHFGVNHIDIYPDTTKEEALTVNVAAIPGYRYYVDGRYAGKITPSREPIQLTIPPHTKRVTIRYFDLPFAIGLLLFTLFWLCFLVALVKKDVPWQLRQES
jgi:hypothetical protein